MSIATPADARVGTAPDPTAIIRLNSNAFREAFMCNSF
jgi:hypothetical protein